MILTNPDTGLGIFHQLREEFKRIDHSIKNFRSEGDAEYRKMLETQTQKEKETYVYRSAALSRTYRIAENHRMYERSLIMIQNAGWNIDFEEHTIRNLTVNFKANGRIVCKVNLKTGKVSVSESPQMGRYIKKTVNRTNV